MTLFEHLMHQAQETFEDRQMLLLAEQLIGNFDENGFFNTPVEEIALLFNVSDEQVNRVLKEIQEFEPYGVGAKNLQESLLIQLRCLGKKETLAYTLLDEHYDNLLHNRIPVIQKKTGCNNTVIQEAIGQIAKLDLHPDYGIPNRLCSRSFLM